MKIISDLVIYLIMFCAVLGCLASIFKPESELAAQFLEGINAIGSIFLPVAGIMAAQPLIASFITSVLGPLFHAIGADQAIAATTFLAVDMGGYRSLIRSPAAAKPGLWPQLSVIWQVQPSSSVFRLL